MNELKSITIFCGSSSGKESKYCSEAFALGEFLAKKNIAIIYGGASIGVMGAVADGALKNKGEVIGIIPTFLATKEIAHNALTKLIEVSTMHERKAKMHDMANGFIMLPGGIGTMEEFFEILTWAQLGLHKKAIGILNVDGYFDDLLDFIQHMVDKGFLKPKHQQLIVVDSNSENLLEKMKVYDAPESDIFIKTSQT